MTETLNKYLQIGLFVILAISAVLFVFFYVNGESMADTVMYWAYILCGITVALLITFPVIFFIQNPKKGLIFLGTLAVFGVLYGISYAFASDTTNALVYEKNAVTSGVSRMIGAGMIMTYILAGLAIVTLVYAGISKAIK
jgi:inner membrane protein involved in colicin E2 resistance